MKPVLYRYRDSESVIKHMDGYTPGEGWEPLYLQDQVDQLQAQLVRQQKSYEAEIKVEIDAALDRAEKALNELAEDYLAKYLASSATRQQTNLDYLDGASDAAEICTAKISELKDEK